MGPEERNSRLWRRLTLAMLGFALALRVCLALGGGQGYWPDESRYGAAQEAVYRFAHGQPRDAWLALIGGADHPLFKICALPAAWADANFGESPVRAAVYFGLFSVAALACVGRCARAAGAGPRESWLAVFFAALANSLFYYTRHLLPYDVSLFFCLAALAAALGPPSAGRSFAAGILAGLGFLSYAGYWIFGAVALLWHVFRARDWKRAAGRAAVAGIGLALPLALAVGAAKALGGDLAKSFQEFSHTINQGDFGRGHAFVWHYLWEAEGGVLAVWIALALYAVARAWRGRAWGRPMGWLAAGAAIYAGLCFCSDAFPIFVVYGRIARLLSPFFCLVAAWGADDLWSRRQLSGAAAAACLAVIGLAAACRMAVPLGQVFPAQFMIEAANAVRRAPPGMFRLRNVNRLYGKAASADDEAGTVLLRSPHPLQFRPYLFEGHNEAQRRELTRRDIAMKLVRLAVPLPPALSGGYPGPLRLRVRFPKGRDGEAEPLLTSGVSGQACFLYVRYLGGDRVQFTYECWGVGGPSSPPIRVDFGAVHELLLFYGGMLPPVMPAGLPLPKGLWERLGRDLLVVMDGRIVLAGRVVVIPSPPERIMLGVNFAGGSSVDESFEGRVLAVEAVRPGAIASYLPYFPVGAVRPDPEWGGYPGPLRLSVTLPPDRAAGSEPLVTAGADAGAECLSLVYGIDGSVRLAHAGAGAAAETSHPLPILAGGRLDLLVSMGALLPPPDDRLYSRHPELRLLSGRLFVVAGDRIVLERSVGAAPSPPQAIRLFSNPAGVADVAGYFTGRVDSVRAADPREVFGRLQVIAAVPGGDDSGWEGYPGPLRLRIRFPDRPAGVGEPLVVSGVEGAGDLIFVRYEGAGRIRLGFDHWGHEGAVSAVADLGRQVGVHELVVSEGVLLPGETSRLLVSHPGWRKLRDWVVVALDGRPVIVVPRQTYRALPYEIVTGFNPVGGSTAERRFSGEILGVERADPDRILDWISDAERSTAPGGPR